MSSIIPGLAVVVVVGFFFHNSKFKVLGVCYFGFFFFPNKYLFRYCQIYRLI